MEDNTGLSCGSISEFVRGGCAAPDETEVGDMRVSPASTFHLVTIDLDDVEAVHFEGDRVTYITKRVDVKDADMASVKRLLTRPVHDGTTETPQPA